MAVEETEGVMDLMRTEDRRTEWFVPSVGPLKLRMCIGLLFLPYTGMVLAYTVIGSMMAEHIHWDRVGAIVVIYFLALGVGGHALDALGSKGPKPWGSAFSRRGLVALAALSIVGAYSIGRRHSRYCPLWWGLDLRIRGAYCAGAGVRCWPWRKRRASWIS